MTTITLTISHSDLAQVLVAARLYRNRLGPATDDRKVLTKAIEAVNDARLGRRKS